MVALSEVICSVPHTKNHLAYSLITRQLKHLEINNHGKSSDNDDTHTFIINEKVSLLAGCPFLLILTHWELPPSVHSVLQNPFFH